MYSTYLLFFICFRKLVTTNTIRTEIYIIIHLKFEISEGSTQNTCCRYQYKNRQASCGTHYHTSKQQTLTPVITMRSSKICRPSTNPMRLAVVALMLSTALCASLSSLDPELRDLSQPSMEQSSNQTRVELLQGVLFAVDKVLDFFVGDFSDINVDGLYGIRLAEGKSSR